MLSSEGFSELHLYGKRTKVIKTIFIIVTDTDSESVFTHFSIFEKKSILDWESSDYD